MNKGILIGGAALIAAYFIFNNKKQVDLNWQLIYDTMISRSWPADVAARAVQGMQTLSAADQKRIFEYLLNFHFQDRGHLSPDAQYISELVNQPSVTWWPK